MKIVVAGGSDAAQYIVDNFCAEGKHKLIVINPSREIAQKIMAKNHISVNVGRPWNHDILMSAGVVDADIFIALCESDVDNYAACISAKKIFHAKKCICVVNDPNNVETYKKLGIDSVISSTYLLANTIQNESSMEYLFRTMSLENNKITMITATILSSFHIANKKIMDIGFPNYANISCIFRDGEVIIPKGLIVLKPKDKLYVTCSPADSKRIIEWISSTKIPDGSEEKEPHDAKRPHIRKAIAKRKKKTKEQ